MSNQNIKKITPLKAIRLKCLDCMCGSKHEVKLCASIDCPLFPYRFGNNPERRGIGRLIERIPKNRLVSKRNTAKNAN